MSHLLHETYFALFSIICIGMLIGKITIKGVSLQSSAILFVAMIFGHFGIQLPHELQQIGLILFVFTVGIQAGPGFFDSFKQGEALKFVAPITVILMTGVLLSYLFHYILGVEGAMQAGMFTGSFSSTSSLAAALEASKNSLVSVGYAITYPFGILGVVLFIRFYPSLFKIDISKEVEKIQQEEEKRTPPLTSSNFIVSNSNVFGKTVSELQIYDMTQCNISRIKKKKEHSLVNSQTVLNEGDIVNAVGTEQDLQKFELVVGPKTDGSISLRRLTTATSKRIVITNKYIIGKKIASIPQLTRYSAIITRIRRSGIDLSPSRSTRLRYGDKVTIVFPKNHQSAVYELIGGAPQKSIDFFPIALSIVLGVLIGQISIPITKTLTIAPGYTGGILITTLLLGRLDKTGPLLWSVAGNTNQLLRQIGLLFFLSSVGTQSGSAIVSGIQQYGIKYFIFGIFMTLLPMIVGTLFSKYVMRLNTLQIFGVLCAGMTSGPALDAASEVSQSNIPERVYSVAFPVALIFTILLSQMLALTL